MIMDCGGDNMDVRNHGTFIDSKRRRVQCNHCHKVVSSFNCLKCHLGCIRGDVRPCEKAPVQVKALFGNKHFEKMKKNFSKEAGDLPQKRNWSSHLNCNKHGKTGHTQTASSTNENTDSLLESSGTERVTIPSGCIDSQIANKGETTVDSTLRQAQKCIGRFFYETNLDFNVVDSLSFRKMINATLGLSLVDYKIPSCQDLKGWILQDEVKEMQKYVEKIKKSWVVTGCSILLDGWIDEKGRNLVNILVNCPEAPVYIRSYDISSLIENIEDLQLLLEEIVSEVGIDNVVQVVANSNVGWFSALSKRFMDKCKNVFWTVSASHCIELMLEKVGMIVFVKEILDEAKIITKFIHGHTTVLNLLKKFTLGCHLIKPSKIRSAKPFMTLENVHSQKQKLKDMFASLEWNRSAWASRAEGKRVADLVENISFWIGVEMVLKATMPLVRILSLMFDADEPLVGHIYESMDQTKETIKKELKSKKSEYMPFWQVIDEIWDNYLHSPLHAAGYYLNPSLFYSDDFYADAEVAFGFLSCTIRMIKDQQTQDLIARQLDEYRHAKGCFEKGSNTELRNTIPPAMWWSCYGNSCPELQRYAVRVLSQDCYGASRYGLKRSLAEKLLIKGRNPMEQERLSDLAFVHYNLQLQQFRSGMNKNDGIVAEEFDSMDDWIVDDATEVLYQNGNNDLSSTKLDCANEPVNVEGPSTFQAKEETV